MHQARRTETGIEGMEAITIVSDRTFPRHAHDQYGIGRMVEGGQLSWSGIGQVEAAAGDVMAANPNEVHDGIVSRGRPRAWRMVYLDPATVARHAGGGLVRQEIAFPVKTCPRMGALVDRLLALANDAETASAEAPAALEEALAAVLDAALGAGLPGGRPERPVERSETAALSVPVRRVLERIHDRPAEPATLDEFAALSGLGRFQVLRRFRAELGITPYNYLTQYRVRLARRLILSGSPLGEAALDAGFADQSHLTRAFTRQIGLPPGRYVKG